MIINEIKEEEKIVLKVEGRIDTNTSVEFQQWVLKGFQKTNSITVDFSDVEYVSSAGLRVILVGYKTAQSKGGMFILKNVRPNVMEVIEMTGFSRFLNIE